nr:sodium/calcium exchanger protein [Candidatus Sigynarchaeota archaeon]
YACLLVYNVVTVKKLIGMSLDDQHDLELLSLVDMKGENKGGHQGNRDGEHLEPPPPETGGKKRVAIVCISMVMLVAGSYFLSEGLDGIVEGIGIAQNITGYVIVALGVNAEEFLLIYKSVKKKVPEVGIGGIIMKTAWNLGITYGLSVLIAPAVPLAPSLFVNTVLIAIAFAFLAGILRKGIVSKKGGITFMAIFASYMFVNLLIVTS